MKIFQVKHDLSYWSLMAADRLFWKEALRKYKHLFAVERMRPAWEAPTVYVRDPARTSKGSFYGFVPGTLVYGKSVCDSDLGEIIERSGEILTAVFDETNEHLRVFNCTACYNCFDRRNSIARWTPDETVAIVVQKFVFHADRIGDCNLFKIPETKSAGLYALVGRDDPEDEFYTQYHALGFTGLKFEEVWSDEAS